MKDKLKRFTMLIFRGFVCVALLVAFLFLIRALVLTRILIFQVIAVVLFLGLFCSGVLIGGIFSVIDFIQKCITKKAAATPDPDELQQ